MKTLGLIHTSATLVPVFDQLCKKHLKGVNTFNIVDDSLIKNTIREGKLTPDTALRVVNYVKSAEMAGADFILVTCSSIGNAVDASKSLVGTPVLRVDQPMADLAIETGKKIGVIATLSTTLEPTSQLLVKRAQSKGVEIELIDKLCEGAFDALMSGDADTHDAIVKEALTDLMDEVDVVVLAQASMARVVGLLDDDEKKKMILSSPELAVMSVADSMKNI